MAESGPAAVKSQEDFYPNGNKGSVSFVKNNSFHLYGYVLHHDYDDPAPPTSLKTLDLQTGRWSFSETMSVPKEVTPDWSFGQCAALLDDKLYYFSGYHRSIHELDVNSLKWQQLTTKNPHVGPLHRKHKAQMFTYGDKMVGVFGGYGGSDRGMPDCDELEIFIRSNPKMYCWDPTHGRHWTNELHLFHTEEMEWLVPEVSGVPPKPCAAFSLTRVDPYRLVLFGGKQLEKRVNEVHILNLDTWHWSGVNIPSSPRELWPVGRSFHSAVSLCDPMAIAPPSPPSGKQHDWLPWPAPELFPSEPCVRVDPKILVIGGLTTDCEPLRDLWELNVNTLTWKQLKVPEEFVARLWHTSAAYYPSPCEATVITHGGTSENVFGKPEYLCTNISRSCILHFGLQSLAKICVDLIVKDKVLLASSNKLPAHIQDELKKQSINTSQLSAHLIARL